jgi:hypothetical protein
MKTFKSARLPSIQTALRFLAPAMALCSSAAFALTVGVPLQQPTATFSQSFAGDFSVARAINGTTADDRGWAIAAGTGTAIPAQTAAFETVNNVGFAGGSILTFTLTQNHTNLGHLLGRFRLSVTTDDRSLFCDGLASGGDVTASWTVLSPNSVTALNTTNFTILGDQSILAGGTTPDTDVYTVSAQTFLTGITGLRLEALEDPSLPFNGPGRWPGNGNFVLSEFEVGIGPIPEPAAGTLIVLAGLSWAALRRGRVTRPYGRV